MTIMRAVSTFFQSGENESPAKVDKYKIVRPLIESSELAESTLKLLDLVLRNAVAVDRIKGISKAENPAQIKALVAYKDFLSVLSAPLRHIERTRPLSLIRDVLAATVTNLNLIEDHFDALFNGVAEGDVENVRASAVITAGYIQSAQEFMIWVSTLIESLEHDPQVVPAATILLLKDAETQGRFANDSLNKWNGHNQTILSYLQAIQKKGLDVAIKSGGVWIDEIVDDRQFADTDTALMVSGMRSPIMMIATAKARFYQLRMEWMTAHRDWMLAKVALEEARLARMDETSPDYKRLQKTVRFYADQVAKWSQKIERART